MFVARNGLVVRGGRIVGRVPSAVRWAIRPLSYAYWHVWWGSWLQYRMMNNPRSVYLVALLVASVAIWWERPR